MCITALTTLYCIYTPPSHYVVYAFNYFTNFLCHHAQLTFRILGKDSYNFIFVLPTPLFYLPIFCVDSPYSFQPPLHIKHYTTSPKPHTISLSFLTITYLFAPPPPQNRSRHHELPSQICKVLVHTVLLPVRIFPEPLKVQSRI